MNVVFASLSLCFNIASAFLALSASHAFISLTRAKLSSLTKVITSSCFLRFSSSRAIVLSTLSIPVLGGSIDVEVVDSSDLVDEDLFCVERPSALSKADAIALASVGVLPFANAFIVISFSAASLLGNLAINISICLGLNVQFHALPEFTGAGAEAAVAGFSGALLAGGFIELPVCQVGVVVLAGAEGVGVDVVVLAGADVVFFEGVHNQLGAALLAGADVVAFVVVLAGADVVAFEALLVTDGFNLFTHFCVEAFNVAIFVKRK